MSQARKKKFELLIDEKIQALEEKDTITLQDVSRFVKESQAILQAVKEKLGKDNPEYLEASTKVVFTAKNKMAQIINATYLQETITTELLQKIQEAQKLLFFLRYKMDAKETVKENVADNYDALRDLNKGLFKQNPLQYILHFSYLPVRGFSNKISYRYLLLMVGITVLVIMPLSMYMYWNLLQLLGKVFPEYSKYLLVLFAEPHPGLIIFPLIFISIISILTLTLWIKIHYNGTLQGSVKDAAKITVRGLGFFVFLFLWIF